MGGKLKSLVVKPTTQAPPGNGIEDFYFKDGTNKEKKIQLESMIKNMSEQNKTQTECN